jgi:hypothetical protein
VKVKEAVGEERAHGGRKGKNVDSFPEKCNIFRKC